MTEQYTCPLDCGYQAGSTGSVKAHITRKTDETHKGLSGPDYGGDITLVDVEQDSQTDTVTDTVTDTDTDSDSDSDPVMGDTDPDADSDEVELPCGHESFDADNAPEPPFRVTCETCGDAQVVTEL